MSYVSKLRFPNGSDYQIRDAESSSRIDNVEQSKQDKLISGTNIKTINNQSILGSGDITIEGSGGVDVAAITNQEIDEIWDAN